MIHFVYKTTNLFTRRFYIGVHSTKNIDDGYLGSGKLLCNSIKKHGRKSFKREILKFCDSRQDALLEESILLPPKIVRRRDCYNMVPGGGGSGPGEMCPMFGKTYRHTDEAKAKMSESKKGDKNPFFGKTYTEEESAALSTIMKSAARRGETHPNFGKPKTKEEIEQHRNWSKTSYANLPILTCPHCNVKMKTNLYARYHGDKCKLNHARI